MAVHSSVSFYNVKCTINEPSLVLVGSVQWIDAHGRSVAQTFSLNFHNKPLWRVVDT